MKRNVFPWIISLLVLFTACKDDTNLSQMGESIQPEGDKIKVGQAQFNIKSENYDVDFMYSRPDSFLLGTFYDPVYGTIHADILAQVEYPKNFVFPENTVADSMVLVMYYKTYFGDKYSPMNVSVYEMDKQSFEYTKPYPSNLDPNDYVDFSKPELLLGEKTFTAVSSNENIDSTYVRIKLSDDFLERFTKVNEDTYTSDEAFFDFFKGMYITTDFGSASMLYINQIDLMYYHSYTYTTKDEAGQDSIVNVKLSTYFPANAWVRQVNRFLHPDKAEVLSKLESQSEQMHYISSPANIYTRIQLPLLEIQNTIEKKDRRLVLNNAQLRVDIVSPQEESFRQPFPKDVLLVKESALERFFVNKEMPSDTCAIIATSSIELNPVTKEYNYFYSFDITGFVSHELKQAKDQQQAVDETVSFIVVPVKLKYNSSSSITEIAQQFWMNAATLYGGNHSQRPIKANFIYTYF